ncbi:hypothetical protein PWT90_08160 [Aphanocladium album]|nr:hypothetical protein PWT90_08160 [Aphanocladium album]
MATPITKFWRGSATPEMSRSDNFFLAPLSINPTRDPSAIIEPDEFKLQGNYYIRCCTLAKPTKHTKRRKSVVWLYGEDIQLKRDGREKFWYCYLCEKQHKQQELPVIGKGNTTALDHLEAKHNINRATGELNPLKQALKDADQLSITDCNNMKSLIFARRLDYFKELLVRWIVCCHIALFQIENSYFRDMLFYLFPPLGNLLPKAADTIRRWVIDAFEAKKEKLRYDMREARSSISISFDLWTSPNCLAVLGVVAHFIDKNGQRRAAVLGLRELMGEHSGENMAEVLLQIFKDYKISGRIGYFMADNATSNDTCIHAVLRGLYPNMSEKQRKRRRLRCFGHIVNLCARAFLIGKDGAKVCKELDIAYRDGDLKKIGELWRKRGAIGRLHNIVRYIRASPQRRQFFRSIILGGDLTEFDKLELIQGQQTRWNSYFMSIGRALNVKERIQIFCDQYEPGQGQKDLSEDRLSPLHWKELEHLHDQLETFYEGTITTEGRDATLADHFQTLDWLLHEIQVGKQKFEELHRESLKKKRRESQASEEFAWLAAAAEVSWQKSEEYFKKADDTAAYYAAISLNPTLKHEWYKEVWSGDERKRPWIVTASTAVKELWLEEYKDKYSVKQPLPTGIPSTPTPRKDKPFASVRNHKRLKISHQSSQPQAQGPDSLDQFIETDIIPLGEDESFDPIHYWNERYCTQPDLAQMALDVLAVPAMSDECERLFSSAKLLLSDRRSRLGIDMIEASECLRAWYGPPPKRSFDDEAISTIEGEPAAVASNEAIKFEDSGDTKRTGTDESEPRIVDHDGLDDEDAGVDAADESHGSP